jgi:hypothetical protein
MVRVKGLDESSWFQKVKYMDGYALTFLFAIRKKKKTKQNKTTPKKCNLLLSHVPTGSVQNGVGKGLIAHAHQIDTLLTHGLQTLSVNLVHFGRHNQQRGSFDQMFSAIHNSRFSLSSYRCP